MTDDDPLDADENCTPVSMCLGVWRWGNGVVVVGWGEKLPDTPAETEPTGERSIVSRGDGAVRKSGDDAREDDEGARPVPSILEL
jgi:hypothetical protein